MASIHRGEPFSRAVAAFPQHFSPLYVATIKASERTGNVKEALSRYISYQEELERVRKKVVSASIYPAILVIVGALVLGFLVFYVVPRFATVYDDMHHALPFFSQVLLAFGSFVGKHALVLLSLLVLALGSCAWALSRPALRAALNRRLWDLPAVGERMKTYQLARLYRTAGMLLNAGIPAVKALDMVRDLLAVHLRPHLTRAKTMIEFEAQYDGKPLVCSISRRLLEQLGNRDGATGTPWTAASSVAAFRPAPGRVLRLA